MKDIITLLSVIKEDRALFFRGVVQFTLWAIYPLFSLYFLTKLVESIEMGSREFLETYLLYYAIFFILYHLIVYLVRDWGRPEIYSGYRKVMHKKYMREFVYLDNMGVEKIGTGKMLSIIEKGFSMWGNLLMQLMENGISLLLTIMYVGRVFLSLGASYVIGYIVIAIVVGIAAYACNEKMLIARKERVVADNMYVKYLVRIVMSKVELMQNRQQEKEMKVLDGELDKQIKANMGMNPYIHWFFFGPNFLIGLVRIGVFFLLGIGVIEGRFSYSEFVALGASLVLLDEVLGKGLIFYKDLTKYFDVVRRLRDTFDAISPAIGFETGSLYVHDSASIELQHVTFGYTDDVAVLEDFSLTISGGKKTALVGASGSGKSTLIKLIAGYIRPDSGSVLVDNQNLTEVSLKSYYQHVGYLTQEPSVFDGTIWENLTYAEGPNAKDKLIKEKVKEAITHAKCEFVYDFPQGLETEIGERGIRLSGGQRQRLAIAKIFLKNPKILILDEPTSALDSFSEEAITEAMHTLFEGRTVIIIAHRLQTVKHADDIILLDNGKVIERGTHTQLLEGGGQYAKMLELQSGF